MLKKTPLILGLSMLVQSFGFLVMFIIIVSDRKRRNAPWAALSVASASAVGGVLFMIAHVRSELKNARLAKLIEEYEKAEENEGKAERPYIPVDDTVNEDEFK